MSSLINYMGMRPVARPSHATYTNSIAYMTTLQELTEEEFDYLFGHDVFTSYFVSGGKSIDIKNPVLHEDVTGTSWRFVKADGLLRWAVESLIASTSFNESIGVVFSDYGDVQSLMPGAISLADDLSANTRSLAEFFVEQGLTAYLVTSKFAKEVFDESLPS